ncbi:hypothetical protein VTN77DRAFT_7438 [Rasamsonia byssochlamydoides]|uniref:uncharacterized protein n=1 Tax=Rasamsonia byssochlamydoides TaxID=89139 RepID=UPI0037431372
MFQTTPIGPLVREAGIDPAETLLEARQLGYTVRLLGLPRDHPARKILPITLREGDQHAQPGEQPAGDRAWAGENTRSRGPWSLGQHLARQLAKALPVDPSGGFEETVAVAPGSFPGLIRVLPTKEALGAAQGARPGLILWSDGSQLDNGRVGAGIALELALRIRGRGPVTFLLDSQSAIDWLRHQGIGPGQGLAIQAHRTAQALEAQGRQTIIQWVPRHCGIEGNEKADQAAKQAAAKTLRGGLGELSIAYTNRARTEAIRTHKRQWLIKLLGCRTLDAQRAYRAQPGWRQDPVAAAAPNKIASRYYQLKTGHAAIGTYLRKILAQESEACRSCQAPKESVYHLLFECREWRKQREALYKALARAKVAVPTAAEDHPEGRLLGDLRATKAILQFLADTTVGCPLGEIAREAMRARRDDEWGLEALQEAEQEGEG